MMNMSFYRRYNGLIVLLAAAALLGALEARGQEAASAAGRDFTFFVFSDIHLGTDQPKAKPPLTPELMRKRVEGNLELMRGLAGKPFPKQGVLAGQELGSIHGPRGLFVLGDLTDGHKEPAKREEQWKTFEEIFPSAGVLFGEKKVPVFATLGNHDGEAAGPQGQGLIRQRKEMDAAGRFAAISENGLHYALEWEGIHIIVVNLCIADSVDEETPFKYGKPGKGSWNDPQGSLSFARDYLKSKVGQSKAPVILMQHYGFDGFSMNDWNWWTPRQRRAMYDLLKDYNIAAIVHGHNHHAEHYRWPDPKKHAADIKAMFGDAPPEKIRQYDIISCGPVCWVFRIKGDHLIAAHLKGAEWSKNNADFVLKKIENAVAE